MFREREGRRRSSGNNNGGQNAEKILVASRFHYYEPSAISLKIPVVVFEDTTSIEFNKLVSAILMINHKILFLKSSDYTTYIIQVNDSFIKMISSYKFVIFADNTIYSGKAEAHDGVQIPLFVDNKGN